MRYEIHNIKIAHNCFSPVQVLATAPETPPARKLITKSEVVLIFNGWWGVYDQIE